MKIKPLNDYVIVKRAAAETTTEGGIILPAEGQETPHQGVVIAVSALGHECADGEYRDIQVEKDDVVLFSQYAGVTMKVDGKEIVVLRENDLMAILEEEEDDT